MPERQRHNPEIHRVNLSKIENLYNLTEIQDLNFSAAEFSNIVHQRTIQKYTSGRIKF